MAAMLEEPFAAMLVDAARELGIGEPPAEALAALEVHFRLLIEWSGRFNLTAERDARRALRRHPLEALAALPHLPLGARHLVDLGSGTGYPGMALAACRPGMAATLVEPGMRKAAFLRAAAREAGLARVTVARTHVRDERDLARLAPFDVFTCRGVAGAVAWGERVAGIIDAGGRALLFVSAADAERAARSGGRKVGIHPLPTRPAAAIVVVDYPPEDGR